MRVGCARAGRFVEKGFGPSVERCPRHAEVASDLGGWRAPFDEAEGTADLAVADQLRSPTEVLTGLAAFRDGVDHTLAFDFVFHLSERGHDREQHGPHRCCCVNITAAEVEEAEAGAAIAEIFSEREHVLR